jgi:hypothetical protein
MTPASVSPRVARFLKAARSEPSRLRCWGVDTP